MKYLILEDEEPAAVRLRDLIQSQRPDMECVGMVDSVHDGLRWFEQHEPPQAIFADIQLSDGLSFEILDAVKPKCPIIFTTAYDHFAIEAFRHHSIDYLLKPIRHEALQQAIMKLHERSASHRNAYSTDVQSLLPTIQPKGTYRPRWIIRFRDEFILIDTDHIAYVFVEQRSTYLVSRDNRQYPIDYRLDEMENQLPPSKFFRINRQFIVNLSAIAKMVVYSKSRIALLLQPASPHETIVSSERSPAFKEWLEGGAR